MLLLLAIVAFSIAMTLYFFVKDIANPLDGMIMAAKRIRDGHLSATVPVVSKDEIGQLGDIINDLTANLQEVLLFVGAVNSDLTDIIEEIENQNLHGMGSYDYIIVCPEVFLSEANVLADYHRDNDGMSVVVVQPSTFACSL